MFNHYIKNIAKFSVGILFLLSSAQGEVLFFSNQEQVSKLSTPMGQEVSIELHGVNEQIYRAIRSGGVNILSNNCHLKTFSSDSCAITFTSTGQAKAFVEVKYRSGSLRKIKRLNIDFLEQGSSIVASSGVVNNEINFGNISISSKIRKSVALTNNGSSVLDLSLSLQNGYVELSSNSCSQLSPSQSCRFILTLSDSSLLEGVYQDSLSIISSEGVLLNIPISFEVPEKVSTNSFEVSPEKNVDEQCLIDAQSSEDALKCNFESQEVSSSVLETKSLSCDIENVCIQELDYKSKEFPIVINFMLKYKDIVRRDCYGADMKFKGGDGNWIESVSGTVIGEDISECQITSCQSGYLLSQDGLFCQSAIAECSLSDAQVNGWDIEKALLAGGSKNAQSVIACTVSSCLDSYEVNPVSKKCDLVLDSNGDSIVENNEFELLLADAASGYSSNVVELESNLVYEFTKEVIIPDNVTIKGPDSGVKPIFRKKSDFIVGVDKSQALIIKNAVSSNLPLINFDSNGDVLGYNGVYTFSARKTALEQLREFYEAQGYFNLYSVNLDGDVYRFDPDWYGSRCFNALGESFVCAGTISSDVVKFTPFYQEILNTDNADLASLNKYSVTPIIKLSGSNSSIQNIDIQCPEDVPYPPMNKMVNVSAQNPYGEVSVTQGIREVPSFAMSGIWLFGAKNSSVKGVTISGCTIGIYSINSSDIEISNNEILTAVKDESILDWSAKSLGEMGVKFKHRFHGYNAIRVHGTQDRNFIIKDNTIGTANSGAIKGIHVHGTSLSNRDFNADGLADAPSQSFVSEDEGLSSLGVYADKSNEAYIMRKNFKIYNNLVQGQHTAGIDIEGDQLNWDVSGNVVQNIKNKFYVNQNNGNKVTGVGLRVIREIAPLNIYNFYNSGLSYSLDFVGSAQNLRVYDNLIQDSEVGIYLNMGTNSSSFAFNNFPASPLMPIASNYNCGLVGMEENCSNQITIDSNIVKRIKTPMERQGELTNLQSYCLFIQDAVGVDVRNNIFESCNVPEFDFNGNAGALRMVGAKKIHYFNNAISIDAQSQQSRLNLATTNGSNRYYGMTLAGSISTTRLLPSEFYISGCLNNVSCVSTYNFKTVAGGTLGTFLNEGGASPSNEAALPFKYIGSSELDLLLP